jgi:hypothetical protein
MTQTDSNFPAGRGSAVTPARWMTLPFLGHFVPALILITGAGCAAIGVLPTGVDLLLSGLVLMREGGVQAFRATALLVVRPHAC